MTKHSINPISAGQALQSMRDSDFDCYSAYAEAIDNSIQANSTEIHIQFDTVKVRKKVNILKVAFVDNGVGMDENLLHHCLVLGHSSRYNDRNGIGRFGVGMTLGAIHECCHVSVFSRQGDNMPWQSTSLDITKPDDQAVRINPPMECEFPNWLANIKPASSGTAVVWSHYDRQVENGSKIIEESKIYFGRVFRKYIWEGISIFVNGELVTAIDPLYVKTEKTKFPNDIPATQYDPIVVDWIVPHDIAEYEGQTDKIFITLSLLSSEIRGERGTGNRAEVIERYINRNQGISITRKGREVFYGPIPYWPGNEKWFTQPDRYWGCEIEFSPLLDKAFQVRNIKRGAVPVSELKTTIYEKISPTIKNFLAEIGEDWDQKAENFVAEKVTNGDHDSGHKIAEKIAGIKNYERTPLKVDDPQKAADELIERITKYGDHVDKIAILESWKSQPYTIEEDTWKGKDFIELVPLGGSDVLLYNNSHILMKKFRGLANKISDSSENESKALASELGTIIDLLLLSYVKAESKFSEDEEKSQFLEDLRVTWGRYAHSYVNEMSGGEDAR